MSQQLAGTLRVLRNHDINRPQHPGRPERQIFQVADRRGDDEERTHLPSLRSAIATKTEYGTGRRLDTWSRRRPLHSRQPIWALP